MAIQDATVPTDEMDELYQGGSEPDEGKGQSIDEEEKEHMGKSAVVPLAILTGKKGGPPKVGDEIVVKLKAIHGEDGEIEYSETPASEIGKDEGYGKEDADKELDEMSNSGGY